MHLDLTIGLIHVIAQQIQKIRVCIIAWQKVLPTKKCLVISFWSFFQVSWQPRRIERTKTTKYFGWCRGIFL